MNFVISASKLIHNTYVHLHVALRVPADLRMHEGLRGGRPRCGCGASCGAKNFDVGGLAGQVLHNRRHKSALTSHKRVRHSLSWPPQVIASNLLQRGNCRGAPRTVTPDARYHHLSTYLRTSDLKRISPALGPAGSRLKLRRIGCSWMPAGEAREKQPLHRAALCQPVHNLEASGLRGKCIT